MSDRVRQTDIIGLINSFLGSTNEEDTDISQKEYIEKCTEISKKQKEDMLNAVLHSAELEVMLDYTRGEKPGRGILGIKKQNSRDGRNNYNLKRDNAEKGKNGKEIGDD